MLLNKKIISNFGESKLLRLTLQVSQASAVDHYWSIQYVASQNWQKLGLSPGKAAYLLQYHAISSVFPENMATWTVIACVSGMGSPIDRSWIPALTLSFQSEIRARGTKTLLTAAKVSCSFARRRVSVHRCLTNHNQDQRIWSASGI